MDFVIGSDAIEIAVVGDNQYEIAVADFCIAYSRSSIASSPPSSLYAVLDPARAPCYSKPDDDGRGSHNNRTLRWLPGAQRPPKLRLESRRRCVGLSNHIRRHSAHESVGAGYCRIEPSLFWDARPSPSLPTAFSPLAAVRWRRGLLTFAQRRPGRSTLRIDPRDNRSSTGIVHLSKKVSKAIAAGTVVAAAGPLGQRVVTHGKFCIGRRC